MARQVCLSCICLVLLSMRAPAQTAELPLAHWQHTAWTGKNGPPPQAGEGMHRSNDGYLWMGARTSLVRFDGSSFVRFDSTNVPALKRVRGCCYVVMQVGPSGTMRVSGPDGLLLAYRDGQFRVEMPAGSGRTGAVMEDRLGRLWGESADRLKIIREGHFESPPLPPGVPDSGLIGIEPDSGKGVWIGTRRQGLWHVNGDSVERIGTGWLRALLQSSDGTLWTVGTQAPYFQLNRIRNGVVSPVFLPDGSTRPVARSAVEGPDGSVWIPTNVNGVLRWHGGLVEQFSTTNGLSSDYAEYLYPSIQGAVWVITDGGFDRLRPAELTYVAPSIGQPFAPFRVDEHGVIWISRSDGAPIRLSGGLVSRQPGPVVVDSVLITGQNDVDVVALSPGGGVWLAPRLGGLFHFTDRGNQRFRRVSGLPTERIQDGLEARDGTVWVKLFGAKFGHVRNGRYQKFSLPDSGAAGPFIEDGSGRLLIESGKRPVLWMVSHDSIVAEIRLPGANPTKALALALEGGDTVWAVGERSLYRVIGDRAVEVNLPVTGERFAGNTSIGVSRGQLWFASAFGISRIPLTQLHRAADGVPTSITPVTLDALDGIPTPLTAGLLFKTVQAGPDGRVWIATIGGLAVADGPRKADDSVPPRVFLDGATLGGVSIPLPDGGTLRPHPRQLGIHFTVPNLGLPERMRVEYQLEHVDTGWVRAMPPYLASYDQLRPGRYRFRVRAWNAAGIPSLEETVLSFRVLAGWEESWWFAALCALVLAGLGAGAAIALNRRRARRTAAVTQDRFDAVLAERTRLARELHDTLLQGFTGITLQLDGVRDSLTATSPPVAEDLSRILQSADRTLREAREMVWDMRQPGLADTNLAVALKASVAMLPNPDGITVVHHLSGTPRALSPIVATTMLRIGKEAIINAINHSKARHIDVALDYEFHHVRLEVRDDGRGARPDQLEGVATARGHWGIAGMRERARVAGGTITIDSTPGWGTRVTVSLPAEPLA